MCVVNRNYFDLILFDEKIRKENKHKEGDSLLAVADLFLQEEQIIKDDIEGILVAVGNGSFSTVRSGTVLANTWSLVKKIPVMAITEDKRNSLEEFIPQLLQKDGYVLPEYNGEPNIRMKKSDS